MSAPIQKLAKFSRNIFSKINSDQNFPEKLKQLRLMINNITAKDVGFDIEQLKHSETYGQEEVAPVTYVKLWEDDIFTMGIFVVKPGGRLPLHDHPGMFGFCKVIHGEMNVTSFNPVKSIETEADEIPREIKEKLRPWQIPQTKKVQLNSDRSFTTSDECCFLNPQTGNIHELKPVGNTSAFLDILAPPYDHSRTGLRECHYYEDLSNGVGDIRWLTQTHQPLDFWCDSLPYFGPILDLPPLSPRT
ncbi:hypothetical protein LOTGIDRAFT_123657 [Lottia gigantea]|uniref:2-aminoethanethiol dioxygenase n=1 Tax=Lottia gigantea TaxID=225164 RepID=V4BNI4_LOTGI|nr:hypothetical protein LOTGIDRAFT_123657 [Lottia gigantea]ESO90404.1 hypothetical protein LOTGIDRAFT_123657 [Lottia gigantea]